jgi:undecaprenyl-diphosphatase
VDRSFRILTHLGGAIATLTIGAVLVAMPLTRALGIAVLVANVGSHLVVQIIKRSAHRPRPHFQDDTITSLIAHPDEFSLPSGHSAAAMAIAMTLVLWRGLPLVPGVVEWGALVLAIIVGMSRVYLRVHYVTDVLLGQLIGVIAAIIMTR